MLTGENGILNRAREAKEKTEDAKTEEQAKMEEAQEIMEAENNKYIRNDELEENNYLKTYFQNYLNNKYEYFLFQKIHF